MDREKATSAVAYLGIAANAMLLIAKLAVGFVYKSSGMISDGLNSAGDVFASAMTLAGGKISAKPRDDNHPYGHGKAEYLFSFVISLSLLVVAGGALKGAVQSLMGGSEFQFSILLILTAAGTIAAKLALYIFTIKLAKAHNSLLIKASAFDHRNDVLLTAGTLLGIVCGALGVYWVDGVVGIAIGLWIGYTGLQILKEAFDVLMDEGVKQDFHQHLKEDIISIEGVDHIDDVRTKPIGVCHLVVVKISVAPDLTVLQGHEIAKNVEQCILKDHDNISEVIVHVNPVWENEAED